MENETKEFRAALAHHVLDLAMEKAEYPEDIPARFAELWSEYSRAVRQFLFSPELFAVRIAETAETEKNNQPEN